MGGVESFFGVAEVMDPSAPKKQSTSEKVICRLIFCNCVSPWNPTKTPILPNFSITGSSTKTSSVRIWNSESWEALETAGELSEK